MISCVKLLKISLLSTCLSVGAVAIADQHEPPAAQNEQAAMENNADAQGDGEAKGKKVRCRSHWGCGLDLDGRTIDSIVN